MPAPAGVLMPHGGHGLSILSSQQAEADFPCLDLVLGQACVPFLKLEALLC